MNYEEVLKNVKDVSFYSTIKNAYDILNKYDFMYSIELEKYLIKEGFRPYISEDVKALINGVAIQKNELANLVKDDKAAPLKKETQKVVEVNNINDLIKEINSDKYIILKSGSYNIGESHGYLDEKVDCRNGQLTIKNVKNLTIVGEGSVPIEIYTDNYGLVLYIVNSENVTLHNLRVGHLETYCRDGVISCDNTKGFTLSNSILYGCGYYGLSTKESSNITVKNTVISDCDTQALIIRDSSQVSIKNCALKRNGGNVCYLDNAHNVLFDAVSIVDNNRFEYGEKAVFYLNNCTGVVGKKLVLENNYFTQFQSGNSEITP